MPNDNDALKSFTRSIEAGLKALYGREVVVNIQFKEPEYEYVTTGEIRQAIDGDWMWENNKKQFIQWNKIYPSNSEGMVFRRIEKKGTNA